MNSQKLSELNHKLDDIVRDFAELTAFEDRKGKTPEGFNFDNKIWPPHRREIRMQCLKNGFYSQWHPINPQLWGTMRAVSQGTWRDEDGWIYLGSRLSESVCFYRLHSSQVNLLANAMKFDTDFEKLILQSLAKYLNESNCLIREAMLARQVRLDALKEIIETALERNNEALRTSKINEP